jgi:hypothetical protein
MQNVYAYDFRMNVTSIDVLFVSVLHKTLVANIARSSSDSIAREMMQ